jgi:hypothetical protein
MLKQPLLIPRPSFDRVYWFFAKPGVPEDVESFLTLVCSQLDRSMGFVSFQSQDVTEIVDQLSELTQKFPACLKAWNCLGGVLANCQGKKAKRESVRIWREGYQLAMEAFPRNFQWDGSYVLDFYELENVPFFQLCFNHITTLRNDNLIFKTTFQLISLCPLHCSGLEDFCIHSGLRLGNYKQVLSVCEFFHNGGDEDEDEQDAFADDYRETTDPVVLYGRVLALWHIDPSSSLLNSWLALAIRHRPLVAEILLLDNPLPPKIFPPGFCAGGSTSGGADEAYLYWQSFGEFWRDSAIKQLLKDRISLIQASKQELRDRWGQFLPDEERRPYPDIFDLAASGVCPPT